MTGYKIIVDKCSDYTISSGSASWAICGGEDTSVEVGGAEGTEGGFIETCCRGARSWNCMCVGMW